MSNRNSTRSDRHIHMLQKVLVQMGFENAEIWDCNRSFPAIHQVHPHGGQVSPFFKLANPYATAPDGAKLFVDSVEYVVYTDGQRDASREACDLENILKLYCEHVQKNVA